MLRIVTGRSGSGKSETLISLMKKTEKAIYIVPEQYSFAAEKKITHAFKVSGMGNPSVYSLRRLAYFLEEKSGGRKISDITPTGKVMVLGDIVRKNADDLTLYGGAAKRGDMASESAVIVTTLKQYNVTTEKLENAIDKTKNHLLKKKLTDCMTIKNAYDKFLSEGYRDADDVLENLRQNIENTPYLCDAHIFIDSFTAFTPLEYKVIESMLKRCKSVSVALTIAQSGDEFVTSKRTKAHLEAIAKNLGMPFVEEIELKGSMYTASDELKIVEKSFFKDERAIFPEKTDKVKIYCAKNKYNEAVAAARQVEALCRDYGYRYKDIAIMARDMANYEKELVRAFERFDIPLFMDKKTPLSSEAAAIFLTFAIRIISHGWKNEYVFAYMKTAFSPLSANEADMLEDYCLKAFVRARDWKMEENWDMKPFFNEADEVDLDYLQKVDLYRRRLVEPIIKLEEKIKGKHRGREMAIAFYEFMTDCRIEEKIQEKSEYLKTIGQGDLASRMKQVYALLIGVLESFDGAFKDKKLSAEEFLSILLIGMESVEIGIIPSTTDSVCAGSIDRARGHGARAVIVIGANEGVFPKSSKESGIFTDAEKKELLQYSIELPPDNEGKIFMEESLVYSALTCAAERLYVSYSVNEEGSKESTFVKTLQEVFPNCEKLSEKAHINDIEKINGAKSTFEDFLSAYAAMKKGGELSDEFLTALDYYKNHPYWKEKLKEVDEYTSYENRTEIIRNELIKSRYGDSIYTSVSSLEKYSQCPFSYFASVTLSLKERKELQVTGADSGSFLHEFVDMFGKTLQEDGRTWRDADYKYIDEKTEEITLELLKGVNKHLLETSPRVRHLFAQLKRIAKRSVTVLCEHMKKGKFEPLGYEIVFDEKGRFKPLTIHLPTGQSVRLRGRIDRADLLQTQNGKYVRIIDYKSGEKSFSLSNIYNGFDLQLAVYLNAICENGNYKSAGMLYFRIDDPIVDGKVDMDEKKAKAEFDKAFKMSGLVLADDEILEAMDVDFAAGSNIIPVKKKSGGDYNMNVSSVATEQEFEAIKKNVTKTVKKLASEILKGENAIWPVRGACKWCQMKAFCNFDLSLKGCKYKNVPKINDKDALLKMLTEEKMVQEKVQE